MSEIKGQYYTTDNNHFVSVKGATPADDKMKMIKINNQYVLIILSRIFKDENFAESAVIKKYMPSILAGNLARPDNNTGFNSKKLGDKIKFIVRTLANKENVADRQKFLNSPFVKCFLDPFTYGGFGTLSELDDKWVNYTNLGRVEKLKERDALNGALGCYIKDSTLPVGLDMSTLIDTLVQTDSEGKYYIVENVDLETQDRLVNATQSFLNLLKSSKEFNYNYRNDHIVQTDFENEDI